MKKDKNKMTDKFLIRITKKRVNGDLLTKGQSIHVKLLL